MSLPVPNLDDRNFEDLMQEAKSLIPIYNKDWTNHNPSDPGITLLELFAWLSELIIYRLNQVSEENYRAFLKLLGIDCIFRWDRIPGVDDTSLSNFITQNYDITWIQPANIEKSADDRTILISDGKNNISFNLSNDRNKVTIDLDTGRNDELEAISEHLFCWDNIPGSDESKLLDFMNERFKMAETMTINKSSDGFSIFISDGTKIVSLILNQSRDYVVITSYNGQKSKLTVTKENDRLKITGLKIYQSIARDIQRGLESLESSSKRYRAITSGDYELLTLECMRLLHPDLKGRVICMNNRDREFSEPDQVRPGHVSVMVIPDGETPEFTWNELVAEENDKLLRFLSKIDGSDWNKKVDITITISPDATQINASGRDDDFNARITTLELKLDTAATKVKIILDGFRGLEFETKSENGNDNIYLYSTSDCRPTELLLTKIKQYLEQRRLITTRLHVAPPDYQFIELKAILAARANTIAGDVKATALSNIQSYLSPLTGGKTGTGWLSGRSLYRSEIYHLLEGIPGVDHVINLTFNGAETDQLAIESYRLISPASRIEVEVK
jgi:hypothetical protein